MTRGHNSDQERQKYYRTIETCCGVHNEIHSTLGNGASSRVCLWDMFLNVGQLPEHRTPLSVIRHVLPTSCTERATCSYATEQD